MSKSKGTIKESDNSNGSRHRNIVQTLISGICKMKIFNMLCKDRHRKYENIKEVTTIENSLDETQLSNTKNEVLPIEFTPADKDEFKKMLLKSKLATITIHYNDNTTESKEWNASKMTKKSDIIGNLRSRPEFRRENWQKANINRVAVTIRNIE